MSSKITRWNDNDDRQLLLAIIQLTGVTPDWKEVGPMLGKTPEAVRYDTIISSCLPENRHSLEI